jgi:hypothetical protein
MHTTTRAARRRGYLSRRERLRLARAEAFSRRTRLKAEAASPPKLRPDELELIDRLVRRDRTAVSSALLQVAGIGAGEGVRRAVLERVDEAACWAQAEGAISARRSEQIARHVQRSLKRSASRLAA